MYKLFIFFSLLGALLLQGCTGGDADGSRRAVTVRTMTVSSSAVNGVQRYSGTIEEKNGTSLSFAVAGTISRVAVTEGQSVVRGQVIATVDDSSLSNVYATAEAALRQASDAYARMKKLHDAGSLSEMKWVEVETALSQAEAAEKIARKNLDDATLRAPYSGVVSSKSVEVGQNVVPGMPVARLVTADMLEACISVPETEIAAVSIGREAVIRVQALSEGVFSGVVMEKGIVANAASRSYNVRLKIRDADVALLPGMVAEVSFIGETSSSSLLTGVVIPAKTVQLGDDNSNFVWTVSDGKAERRTVTIGEFTAAGVVITSGLKDGDVVIVEGQQKVCNGTNVEVI